MQGPKVQRSELSFTKDNGDLICPRCGSNYLHQGDVVIYQRNEDAEHLTKITANSDGAKLENILSKGSGNPSLRRDGVVITFRCEECSEGNAGILELTIAQHKGNTEMAWRFTDLPTSK